MSSKRLKYLLLAVVFMVPVSIGAAAMATAAGSKSNSTSTATLTLSVKAKKSLARQHVTVRALRPATRRKSGYALPVSSGKWNFTKATGTLNLKGVLAVAVRKRSVKLNSVTFTRRAKGAGQLTVKLARHKVKLFTVTGRARVKRSSTSETISGLTAKLTKAGATRLNRALHSHVFHKGESFGSFTVKVSNSPVTGAPGAGAGAGAPITGASSTGAGVAFAPAFRSLLDSAGLGAVPLLPGSNGLPAPLGTTAIPGLDGTGVTLPLNGSTAGASFANGVLTGTIPLSGGLQLGNGTLSVSLTNPQLTLGTGTEGSSLSFEVNGGPEVKLFDLDTSQLEQSALPNGTLDLQGLLATLSSEGASSLNTALGQNLFTTGQPVGGVTLIVPNPPSG
ncbi:MAG TPA: hypothetical protein VFH80_01975 [Solirubrobacteraceae bacterium]|nr:hypothetical protein [Solirubrobacteraceae bacterium]